MMPAGSLPVSDVLVLEDLELQRNAEEFELQRNAAIADDPHLIDTDATTWLIAAVKDLRARVDVLEADVPEPGDAETEAGPRASRRARRKAKKG